MEIKKYVSIILKNWKNLAWLESTFFRITFSFSFRSNKGIYILEEPWDNLIILDACRYDTFSDVFKENGMKGRLEHRISKGTETTSFLLENFSKSKHGDIVYITANPFVDRLLKGKFYKIIPVWDKGWDEKSQTVLPQSVYEHTLDIMSRYSDKRFIIHFLQPHSPYPNGTGERDFDEELEAIIKNKVFEIKYKLGENYYAEWPYIGLKSLKVNKLKDGYKENLRLAMPYVEKLIDILPGRTVVTADHGEAFGEKIHPLIPIGVYGHMPGIRIPALIKVPWLIVEPEEKEFPKDVEQELTKIKKRFTRNKKEEIRRTIKNLKLKGKI